MIIIPEKFMVHFVFGSQCKTEFILSYVINNHKISLREIDNLLKTE